MNIYVSINWTFTAMEETSRHSQKLLVKILQNVVENRAGLPPRKFRGGYSGDGHIF